MAMVKFGCPIRILWFLLLILQAHFISTDSNIQRRDSDVTPEDLELCKRGETLHNHALRGGRKAGAYYKIGRAKTFDKCKDLCCSNEECSLALYVKKNCYSVECKSAQLCKPIKAHRAIRPSIFRRYKATVSHGRDESLLLPNLVGSNITLKREKRFGSCQHYTGLTCSKYLDPNRLVYYDEPPSAVEHRLSGPFNVIQNRFNPHCKKYALPALCLTSFPYCESKPHPQPVRLCKEDCEELFESVCNHDFNLAKKVALKYPPLSKIIPDCANLTALTMEGDDCVKLGFEEDDNIPTDRSTSKTMDAQSDRPTSIKQPSSIQHTTLPNKTTSPSTKSTSTKSTSTKSTSSNANTTPLQQSHANIADVQDVSEAPVNLTDTLSIPSNTPTSLDHHPDTLTTPSHFPITLDQEDQTSSEDKELKITSKTTYTPINTTSDLHGQSTHILPTVSRTPISTPSLLSSVFSKQKEAISTSENPNLSSVLALTDSSIPTVLNATASTDEVNFESDAKDKTAVSDSSLSTVLNATASTNEMNSETGTKSHTVSTVQHTKASTKGIFEFEWSFSVGSGVRYPKMRGFSQTVRYKH